MKRLKGENKNEDDKKVLGMVLCGVMTVGMITGCGGSDSSTTNDAGNTSADAAQEISVVSREDGSGTRGAFVELLVLKMRRTERK